MPYRQSIPSVFILDDDNEDINIAAHALQPMVEAGTIIIRGFNTTEELLKAADDLPPAICILDYHLRNGENGWTAMRKIRALCPMCFFIALSNTQSPMVLRDFANSDGRRLLDKGNQTFGVDLLQYVTEGLVPWAMMREVNQRANKYKDDDDDNTAIRNAAR